MIGEERLAEVERLIGYARSEAAAKTDYGQETQTDEALSAALALIDEIREARRGLDRVCCNIDGAAEINPAVAAAVGLTWGWTSTEVTAYETGWSGGRKNLAARLLTGDQPDE